MQEGFHEDFEDEPSPEERTPLVWSEMQAAMHDKREEFDIHDVPKVAFELEHHFGEWVNWPSMYMGILIAEGKTPQQAAELAKKYFRKSNDAEVKAIVDGWMKSPV
jgi:hypothetical protein